MDREYLLNAIEEKKEEIEEKKEELKDLEDGDKYDEYDNWLDELQEPYKVGCCTFYPSEVLKRCDEIAYNCGYDDFVECEREHYEEEIDDLKTELNELEDELKEFDLTNIVKWFK